MPDPAAIPDPGPRVVEASPSVEDRPDGWRVHRFARIDSTNRWLLDRARAGAPERTVAVADHQSAGRGRLGRTWEALPGSSLLVSVLLRPTAGPDLLGRSTMAVGLALTDALFSVAGLEAGLKWPNDLVVADRKLAGVLAESDLVGGRVRAVVVGAGVNLQTDAVPSDLGSVATSCEAVTGRAPDRDALLVAFLKALDHRLAPGVDLPAALRERSATLGRRVRVDRGGGRRMEGSAVGILDHGELVVRLDDGTEVTVAVGDVVHLRAVDGPAS